MAIRFGLFEASSLFPVGRILLDIVNYLGPSLNITYEMDGISDNDMRNFKVNNVIKEVTVGICVGLLLAGCVGCLIELVNLKDTSHRTRFKKRIYCKHIWQLFWSLIRVIMLLQIKRVSFRILLAFWYMMVILLSVYQSCTFTAHVSFPSFLTINEFKDILAYPDAQPKISNESVMHKLLRAQAKENSMAQIVLTRIEEEELYFTVKDFMGDQFLEDICQGDLILITNDFYMGTLATLYMTNENDMFQFFISPSQGTILQGFLLSNNLSSRFVEELATRITRIFGCKTYDYILGESELLLSRHTWKPQLNDQEKSLTFKDLYIGFSLLLAGYVFATCLILYEFVQSCKS